MSANPIRPRRVLAISGSTRHASTNSAFVRTAARCAPPGIVVDVHSGIDTLPHFNPDDDKDPLPIAVRQLRDAIGAADALLFCTPEYAGTLPGSFKNLLDWTVGGTEIAGKPVGWARVAADPRRGDGAHATLGTVLGYVQARIVDDACRQIPVPPGAVGADGYLSDGAVCAEIGELLQALVDASIE